MNYFEQTCKQFFFKLLLGLYLVANFSLPIMEGIHFLMHLNDGSQLHSVQSHSNKHTHTTLDLMGDLLVDKTSKPTPNTSDSSEKLKKIKQFIESPSIIHVELYLRITKKFLTILSQYKSPILNTNSPPPDIQIS